MAEAVEGATRGDSVQAPGHTVVRVDDFGNVVGRAARPYTRIGLYGEVAASEAVAGAKTLAEREARAPPAWYAKYQPLASEPPAWHAQYLADPSAKSAEIAGVWAAIAAAPTPADATVPPEPLTPLTPAEAVRYWRKHTQERRVGREPRPGWALPAMYVRALARAGLEMVPETHALRALPAMANAGVSTDVLCAFIDHLPLPPYRDLPLWESIEEQWRWRCPSYVKAAPTRAAHAPLATVAPVGAAPVTPAGAAKITPSAKAGKAAIARAAAASATKVTLAAKTTPAAKAGKAAIARAAAARAAAAAPAAEGEDSCA